MGKFYCVVFMNGVKDQELPSKITLGNSGSIAVAFIGKVKTTMQMIAILFLLYYDNILFLPIALLGQILIYIAAFLTIISMIYYLKIAFKIIKEQKDF